MNKTAILLGSTGMTGSALLELLLNGSEYNKVISFVRQSSGNKQTKLEEHIVDFDDIDSYKNLVIGNDLFCCLGTTIKKARSQEAFEKVDYHYPIEFARIARENGVTQCLIISSLGANPQSGNFYLRTKGKTEVGLKALGFESLAIFQPSLLLGNRKEYRLGEKVGSAIMRAFLPLFIGKLKKYRAIKAADVAQAMFNFAQQNARGIHIYESDKINSIAKF